MSDQRIRAILDKNMSRRQFLTHIGLVILGVLGINSLLSQLMNPGHSSNRHAQHGFGGGKFGK